MRLRRGLTIIEFLVVLAIVAVLIAIMLPSLGGHGRPVRTKCMANLRFMSQALLMYASANGDRLPQPNSTAAALWLTDQDPAFVPLILAAMPRTTVSGANLRKIFYCPASVSQDPASWWSNSSLNILGYAMFTARGTAASVPALPARPSRYPPLTYHDRFTGTTRTSEIELAADLIVSNTAAAPFRPIAITRPLFPPITVDTNHMPGSSGANVLCLDGHVEIRPFSAADATPIQQPHPTPVYLWLPQSLMAFPKDLPGCHA